MKLTKSLTVAMVVVLLTAGVVATGAAVPGVTAQQDGPDEGTDAGPPEDGGPDDTPADDETETEADETDENETDENETDEAEAESGLSVESLNAPDSVSPGANVTVVADISNEGDERTTEEVEFRVGGDVVDRQFVTVEGGETTTATFSANTSGLEAGDVRHGVFTPSDGAIATLTLSESFTLDELDAPENVSAGENVSVNATVTNPNDFETTQQVTFRLEGETVASENVTLAGGESTTVEFSLSTEGVEPGDYFHSVFTRDGGEFADLTVTEPGPTEATVTFEDQESDGTTVTVQNLTLPSDGYVVIHNETLLDGDAVGSVIGVSEYLEAGQYEDVTVELFTVPGATFDETELTEDQTLIAMPHNETTGDEAYDFVTTDGASDPPFLTDGEAVTDDATVTVATEEPDNETETPADEETATPADEGTATPEDEATETPADGATATPEDAGTETPADEGTATPDGEETGTTFGGEAGTPVN